MSTEAFQHHEAKEEALALLELKHGSAATYLYQSSTSVRSPDLGSCRPATNGYGVDGNVEKPPSASIRVGEIPYFFNKSKVS